MPPASTGQRRVLPAAKMAGIQRLKLPPRRTIMDSGHLDNIFSKGPVLEQHLYNIAQERQKPNWTGEPLTPTKTSELNGEEQAAEHMSGRQDPVKCSCGADFYRQPIDWISKCPNCNRIPPSAWSYRMVKGYSGGGPGIDQIWVAPPNWNPLTNDPPLTHVALVEAKGGSSQVTTEPRYKDAFGPDGTISPGNSFQMTPNWAYCIAREYAQTPGTSPELSAVAKVIQDAIAGRSAVSVHGLVLNDGRPVPKKDLPV